MAAEQWQPVHAINCNVWPTLHIRGAAPGACHQVEAGAAATRHAPPRAQDVRLARRHPDGRVLTLCRPYMPTLCRPYADPIHAYPYQPINPSPHTMLSTYQPVNAHHANPTNLPTYHRSGSWPTWRYGSAAHSTSKAPATTSSASPLLCSMGCR